MKKRNNMKKKTDDLKTFRVGYTFHNYIDVQAKDEDDAKDIVSEMSTEDLASAYGTDFTFDYCDIKEDK